MHSRRGFLGVLAGALTAAPGLVPGPDRRPAEPPYLAPDAILDPNDVGDIARITYSVAQRLKNLAPRPVLGAAWPNQDVWQYNICLGAFCGRPETPLRATLGQGAAIWRGQYTVDDVARAFAEAVQARRHGGYRVLPVPYGMGVQAAHADLESVWLRGVGQFEALVDRGTLRFDILVSA